MYALSSLTITFILLCLILLANESGYRLGRRVIDQDAANKDQTNTIQASMLGLLALLLGFTFTMALQRHDGRSQAVIEEANAIGTAYLRVDLLPAAQQASARDLLRQYTRLRVSMGQSDRTDGDARQEAASAVNQLQGQLWRIALDAAALDSRPATTGLFIQSLNEVIDAFGRREAALNKHVPEIVLLVLFCVFIIAGAVLGYASGSSGARPGVPTFAMATLIALVILVIIDLDRPRRGFIQVNQQSMLEVAATLERAAVAPGASAPGKATPPTPPAAR